MTGRNMLFCLIVLAVLGKAQETVPCRNDQKDLLDQGWNCDTQWKFWYTSQGSAIMPYSWFVVLNLKDRAIQHGYLPMPNYPEVTWPSDPPNPGELPIGFAVDKVAGKPDYVGMTCAACHTEQIVLPAVYGHPVSRRVIVNGGPTNADFFAFLEDITNDLRKIDADNEGFTAFAKKVNARNNQETVSRSDFRAELASLQRRVEHNRPDTPYGPGRVDAFGHIFNQIVNYDQQRPANAPVSYPFLWLSPWLDMVQWNASASNAGTGALLRNVGEGLGVFGRFSASAGKSGFGYQSTINTQNMLQLECWLRILRPPQLPIEYRHGDLAAAGAVIYQNRCASCHPLAFQNRTNLAARISVQVILWGEPESVQAPRRIATESLMTDSFLSRAQDTGSLAVSPVNLLRALGTLLPTVATGGRLSGQTILGAAIVNTAIGDATHSEAIQMVADVDGNAKALLEALTNTRPQYKAGPLNGVWATAPYLHNGSVRTIDDLLLKERPANSSFCLDQGDFDNDEVGFKAPLSECESTLDTTLPGNKNQGHSFGTDLSPTEKAQLKEYLKSL